MKATRTIQIALLSSACALVAGTGWGQATPEFSADYVTTSVAPAGRGPQTTKVYVAQGFLRTESLDRGHVMATVQDYARQKSIQIVPDQGWYAESDLQAGRGGGRGPDVHQHDINNPCADQEGTTCAKIGIDMVDGRSCDNWEFTGKDGKKWTACFDQQIHLLLRRVADGRTSELRNIKLGKQDPSLFRPAPDLKPGGVDQKLMQDSLEEVRQHELQRKQQEQSQQPQ
jgi:hypothetical protein